MSPLPTPRFDFAWVQQITEWLNSNFQRGAQNQSPGALVLSPSMLPRNGALPCDGGLYARTTYPLLFRTIGTTYNTGGESAANFRVPNIPAPTANTEWRISTGA